MDTSKKYRRFGIGALIVLGVVILIAVIVIANTLNKTPKASTEETSVATTSQEKKETKKEEKKTEPTTTTPVVDTKADTNSMPSTGPEDAVLPILLIAASAYLISLNVNWAKRGLKDEEKA